MNTSLWHVIGECLIWIIQGGMLYGFSLIGETVYFVDTNGVGGGVEFVVLGVAHLIEHVLEYLKVLLRSKQFLQVFRPEIIPQLSVPGLMWQIFDLLTLLEVLFSLLLFDGFLIFFLVHV